MCCAIYAGTWRYVKTEKDGKTMQREEYVYQVGKVSLLFADSDRSQCRAVELYAQEHAYVELCAAVTDAGQLLDAVQRGLRPQVLVLDVLLKGPAYDPAAAETGGTRLPPRA